MDINYLLALISLLVGVAAGFPAIYARYPSDALKSASTLPGVVYLGTRGLFPAGAFIFLYHRHLLANWLPLWALALGTGAEALLRSQFLVKESPRQGGGIDELLKGPLDLLRWYQDRFLGAIDTARAKDRLRFVRSKLPTGTFKELCTRVVDNSEAFREFSPELKLMIQKLTSEFDQQTGDPETIDKRYRIKLGFIVLRLAGHTNFETLFA